MWNRYRQTADFTDGKPWLLRFFDQIRFYPVTESELLDMRKDFISGRFRLNMENTVLNLKQYNDFLHDHSSSIDAFRNRQQAAFEAERQRWQSSSASDLVTEDALDEADVQSELDLPEGAHPISAQVSGTVWKLLSHEGEHVTAGQPIMLVESMKMEFPVESPVSGLIKQLFCKQGSYVSAGQILAIIEHE